MAIDKLIGRIKKIQLHEPYDDGTIASFRRGAEAMRERVLAKLAEVNDG